MTDIIKQLNDISVTNTYKLHDLLDRVLGAGAINFPENEIKFDQDRVAFVTAVGDYTFIVQRDMNTFNVVSRVIKDNEIVAECVISIIGEYSEKYGRMDFDTKTKVSAWFNSVSTIDVSNLVTGEPPESDKNVDEDMPETVDAEIVSEGD